MECSQNLQSNVLLGDLGESHFVWQLFALACCPSWMQLIIMARSCIRSFPLNVDWQPLEQIRIYTSISGPSHPPHGPNNWPYLMVALVHDLHLASLNLLLGGWQSRRWYSHGPLVCWCNWHGQQQDWFQVTCGAPQYLELTYTFSRPPTPLW